MRQDVNMKKESAAKMKQASERIKRIKAEKEERFKMQLEEQRKEERQRKEKDDEEKRQMLQKVTEQRKESIKSQKATDLSKIIDEQTHYRQKLIELENQVEQRQKKNKPEQTEKKESPLSEESPQDQTKNAKKESSGLKETSRSAVTGALKLVLLLMKASKGKSMTEEEKLNQEDQRIKEVELEKLEEPTEENAAIVRGDWMHRIKPVIQNHSKRSSKNWTRLEEVVEERCKKFLSSKPVEKLMLELKEDEELSKEEYSKVKTVIQEMIMKALPND